MCKKENFCCYENVQKGEFLRLQSTPSVLKYMTLLTFYSYFDHYIYYPMYFKFRVVGLSICKKNVEKVNGQTNGKNQ
jgi:hypothetical protein